MKIISPRKIFKSVSFCEHAESLSRGKIILRSIEFFRSHPCQEMKDFDEFSTSKKGHSIGLTNPALIFCSHKFKPKGKNHVIEIRSPCELFIELKEKLSPAVGNAYFGEVIYTDPESTEYYPINFYCERVYLANEINLDTDIGIEIAFYKNSKFAHENEVRMCFLVCPERLSTITKSDIKIKYWKRFLKCDSSYPEKPVFHCEEELNFTDWKKQRSAKGNNRDFFWFEAHINVSNKIANTFTNLSHEISSQNC